MPDRVSSVPARHPTATAHRRGTAAVAATAVVVALQALALTACGGGSSTTAEAPVVVFTLQPASTSARAGTSVTFSVVATGSGLQFRWQLSLDGGLGWSDIAGALAAEYTVANPTVQMDGYFYRVVVTDAAGRASTSTPARLSVAPLHAVGEVFRDCTDACPEMVVVPSGSYTMGPRAATDALPALALPVHGVTLARAFALGRGEVTRGEFARFVAATSYRTDAETNGCWGSTSTTTGLLATASWRNPGFTQGDTEPVVCVSWNDAQAYIAWLNTQVAGGGYRLPTEAEWEYAARAGSSTTRYPWGDDLGYAQVCSYANSGDLTATATVPRFATTRWTSCADGFGYTAPIDGLPANAFGLRHMLGNAWEWVQDGWHPSYAGAPTDGSAWAAAAGETAHVYRGGSWNNHPTYLDPSYRARNPPAYAEESLGFRVARSL